MQEMKAFQMRVPKDIWLFLKHEAAEKETSMVEIILSCVRKYKKNEEKKLTDT